MKALKREQEQVEKAALELQEQAIKAGADRAEVCATYGVSTKMTLEKQDFHLACADSGFDFGLRVAVGDRQGYTSCNSTDSNILKEMAIRAVEIAGFAPSNPYNQFGATDNIPVESPPEALDEQIFNLSVQTQKEWTQQLAKIALKDPLFRLNDGSLGVGSNLFLITNSKGTHKCERDSAVTWSAMGMGVDGDKITSFDYFSGISREFNGTLEKIASSTRRFCESVLASLKTGPAKSYKGNVLFSPRAVLDVLLPGLMHHLNARSVVENISKWNLETTGNTVVNDQITLIDNPWLVDRAGWTRFDREGTPTRPLPLIENGILANFIYDNYAAAALNAKSTGHARGGPSTLPTTGAHCLNLSAGQTSLSQLHQNLRDSQGDYLVVHRFSGQSDPVTGDFSGVAKGADWYSKGERAYSVAETMVSGNLFECLGPALTGLSKETGVIFDSAESPWLSCESVSVTTGNS